MIGQAEPAGPARCSRPSPSRRPRRRAALEVSNKKIPLFSLSKTILVNYHHRLCLPSKLGPRRFRILLELYTT